MMELYDRYGKTLELVLEVLSEGGSERESREKTRFVKATKGGWGEIVLVEMETNIKLIHVKKRRGR